MTPKDPMLDIEKIQPPLQKNPKDVGDVTCVCGAVMEPFAEGRIDGWKCPACGRVRPVISSHRKDPSRWPSNL